MNKNDPITTNDKSHPDQPSQEHWAAEQALKPKQGWQPIETAPKNGDSVLLYPHFTISSWDAEVNGWSRWSEYQDSVVRHTTKFTHWMPLPEPPK